MYENTIQSIVFANPAVTLEDIAKVLKTKAKDIMETFTAAKRESEMIDSVLAVSAGDFWFQPPTDEGNVWVFHFSDAIHVTVYKENFHWFAEIGDCFEEPLLNPEELGLKMSNRDSGGHQYYKMFDSPIDPAAALGECIILSLKARFGEGE